jgi:hypothetical protein
MCATGEGTSAVSAADSCQKSRVNAASAASDAWVCKTPFALPVLPEVYSTIRTSPGLAGLGGRSGDLLARRSSYPP